jgi:predicted dehydrogenase
MGKSIDAVTVSTPDHCHAAPSIMAMRMGKNCFCQKPLTHTLYEARLMGQVAKEMKVATMMGNQGTANKGVRKAAALLKAKALGEVKEVHVWTNRPIWPQGGARPESDVTKLDEKDAAKFKKEKANVNWDLWLGPAPYREFAIGYHPLSWRGWWDFGTGALGDMACHTMNMPFMGLDLRNPISVQAKSAGHNKDSYPKWSVITFEFAANDWRPAVKLFWYDGGQKPNKELIGGKDPVGSGCAVVGAKATLYSPNDYGAEYEVLGDVTLPEVQFEESPGHFEEWVRAIKGGKQAKSNFTDYAGPLTETILLGNLAVWVADKGEGEKVEWDAENQKVKNISGLEPIIKMEYRNGYKL